MLRSLKHLFKVDIHFATRGLQGWPKVWVQVRKLTIADVLVCCLWSRVLVHFSTLMSGLWNILSSWPKVWVQVRKSIIADVSVLFCCLWPKVWVQVSQSLISWLLFWFSMKSQISWLPFRSSACSCSHWRYSTKIPWAETSLLATDSLTFQLQQVCRPSNNSALFRGSIKRLETKRD